jgi:hypothetical protein
MSQAGTFNNGVFPPGTVVQTLTGNAGGPVGPDGADNINIVGSGVITVTGNPGTNTLTISDSGPGATTYQEDVGSATPAANILIVSGGTNMNTSGAGNTVTINLDDSIALPNTNAGGTTGLISLGGVDFVSNYGTSNAFFGGAGNRTLTTAASNVGVGKSALIALTTGADNVGVGFAALSSVTTGPFNTAVGYQALSSITTTGANSAFGTSALQLCTGVQNTGIGFDALISLTSGGGNTALGYDAGNAYTSTEANNIVIGNNGVLGESNTIHIGTQGGGAGQQNKAFMAGIVGVTVANQELVTINSATGQLGVTTGGSINNWIDVTAASQAMAVNTGYTANRGTLITFTLPATAAYGTVMRIAYVGAGGYKIAQNGGQTIHFGSTDSTLGIGGSVSSNTVGDCIELLCITADTDFRVLSSVGNFTVV